MNHDGKEKCQPPFWKNRHTLTEDLSFDSGEIERKKNSKLHFERMVTRSMNIPSFHVGGIWTASTSSCSIEREKDARWDQSSIQYSGKFLLATYGFHDPLRETRIPSATLEESSRALWRLGDSSFEDWK